jgi:hypothetical protein
MTVTDDIIAIQQLAARYDGRFTKREFLAD